MGATSGAVQLASDRDTAVRAEYSRGAAELRARAEAAEAAAAAAHAEGGAAAARAREAEAALLKRSAEAEAATARAAAAEAARTAAEAEAEAVRAAAWAEREWLEAQVRAAKEAAAATKARRPPAHKQRRLQCLRRQQPATYLPATLASTRSPSTQVPQAVTARPSALASTTYSPTYSARRVLHTLQVRRPAQMQREFSEMAAERDALRAQCAPRTPPARLPCSTPSPSYIRAFQLAYILTRLHTSVLTCLHTCLLTY